MMQLFVTLFYFIIVLRCFNMGQSETNVSVTTKRLYLEANDDSFTKETNEAIDVTPQAESNGSIREQINLTGTPSPMEITINGNISKGTESITQATTVGIGNNTDDDESDDDNVHSSFNLALIPATAVFVLMIFICFKCCKWFRKYTRGEDKDVTYYAVILTDDDIDHVPIDTISSNTSLLRSNDSEDMGSSNKKSRKQSRMYFSSRISSIDEKAVKYVRNNSKANVTNDGFGLTNASSLNDVPNDKNERTNSGVKRTQKMSVSFSDGTNFSEFQSQDSLSLTQQPNNVRCSVRKSTTEHGDAFSLKGSSLAPAKVTTSDAGTQTNKSFRFSLRMSKASMSGNDASQGNMYALHTVTSLLDSQKIQVKDRIKEERENGVNNDIDLLQTHVTAVEDTNNANSETVGNISKYPIDTNVEFIEKIKTTEGEIDTDSDSADEVFENTAKENPTHSDGDLRFDSKHLLKTCQSANSGSKYQGITKSLAQPVTILCKNCNANFSEDVKEHICDFDSVLLPDDIPSSRNICNECKLLGKANVTDLKQTVNSVANERIMASQCHNSHVNDRPVSSSSLESSGYAELSSSEYSSGSH